MSTGTYRPSILYAAATEPANHLNSVDHEGVHRAVERAIDELASGCPMIDLRVQARTVRGAVVLTGWCSSMAARWALGEVVMAVPGIHTVVNDIRLPPG